MPAYRICTADGVTQLTDGLAKKLKELLEKKVEEEQVSQWWWKYHRVESMGYILDYKNEYRSGE